MIVYPIDADTSAKKTEYAYLAQEQLRVLHNKFVEWKETGLDPLEYATFPPELKQAFPYVEKLTKTDMIRFIKKEFEPRQNTISEGILTQRAALKSSNKWTVDPWEIPKFEETLAQRSEDGMEPLHASESTEIPKSESPPGLLKRALSKTWEILTNPL